MSFYYDDPENEENEERLDYYRPIEERDIKRPEPEKPKGSFIRFITSVLLAGILGSVITMGTFYWYLPEIINSGILSKTPPANITIEPEQDYTVYSAVAEKAMPSVVGITTVTLQKDVFFGTRKSTGLGTGVIIDERGYILTNSHVVGDGNVEEVMVLFHDGTNLAAEVLWNDVTLDLAIIKSSGKKLQPAELGDSDNLKVGEIAVAIGNPLGLNFERTLTQGVVSGLNRSIAVGQGQSIENLIQTDASINPGNSGGPLLNARGQVIGINTAKIQTGEGLGFSIPINTAKPIVDQFIEQGEFTRVYLGIRGMNVDGFQGRTGVELNIKEGIYVVAVEPDSAADAYDIRSGDIIIGIGGNKVDTMGELTKELYKFRPGDKTRVKLVRNEREMELEITL